ERRFYSQSYAAAVDRQKSSIGNVVESSYFKGEMRYVPQSRMRVRGQLWSLKISKPHFIPRFGRGGCLLPLFPRTLSTRCCFSRCYRRSRFFLAFHLCQALFQRSHQINHWRELLGFFDLGDFAALELGFNELSQVFLEFVPEFFWLPFRGESFDELMSNFYFRVLEFNIRCSEAFHFADLFFVIHGVEHQSALVRSQENRVFPVMHGQLSYGNIFAFF